MDLKVGDRVRFLNDVGEAEVLFIRDKHTAIVRDETGFDYEYPLAELLKVSDRSAEYDAYDTVEPSYREILDRNIDSEAVKRAQDDFKLKYKNKDVTNLKRKGEMMEVDLHIHELVDSERGLSNGEIVEIQMEHFERMMRVAEEKKVSRVIFIHGVGQGVLRNEIRQSLEMYYPEASFHDADHREYGYGATEVRIRFGGNR